MVTNNFKIKMSCSQQGDQHAFKMAQLFSIRVWGGGIFCLLCSKYVPMEFLKGLPRHSLIAPHKCIPYVFMKVELIYIYIYIYIGGPNLKAPLCFYYGECPMFPKKLVMGDSKWIIFKKNFGSED